MIMVVFLAAVVVTCGVKRALVQWDMLKADSSQGDETSKEVGVDLELEPVVDDATQLAKLMQMVTAQNNAMMAMQMEQKQMKVNWEESSRKMESCIDELVLASRTEPTKHGLIWESMQQSC